MRLQYPAIRWANGLSRCAGEKEMSKVAQNQVGQAGQEEVVEVELEKLEKMPFDSELQEQLWQVVGMHGVSATIRIVWEYDDYCKEGPASYLLRVSDVSEGGLVLVRKRKYCGSWTDYHEVYSVYRVEDGQLVRATHEERVGFFGDWLFYPESGDIVREAEWFQIEPGQFGYWEALEENLSWQQVVTEAAQTVGISIGDIDSMTDNRENGMAGVTVLLILDQLIKTKQRAEAAEAAIQVTFEIVSKSLDSTVGQSPLAALIKSGQVMVQGHAHPVVNDFHEIAAICQQFDPELQLPKGHLRPKEPKGS